MRPTRAFSALFAFLAFGGPVRAQPVVTSVSGPLTHDGTLTINGSAFGVKTPPEPLVWDDGQADVPLDTYYDETLPTTAQQGPEYNMAYRVASYRGIGSPDGRIQYILGGAHATDNQSGMYFSGNNVSIGRNLRSFQYFAQYWYRVDPLYDEANHPSLGENLKELCLSGAENEIYGGMWGYYAWCGSHVPDRNYTGPVRLSRGPVDCPSLPYACSSDEYVVTHSSPINGWIKMQWKGDYDPVHDNPTVVFTTYPDGQVTAQSHYGTAITTYEIQWGCGYPNCDDGNNVDWDGCTGCLITEFRVNTTTAGDQWTASVAVSQDGSFVAAWESNGQDGAGYGIYGQRFDATGMNAGTEFQVNTHTANDQQGASVAVAQDGSFVVLWQSDLQDGDSFGIYGQRFTAQGSVRGTEFGVNTVTADRQDYPLVAMMPDGSFMVVWQNNGQDGSATGVFGRRFDAQGLPLGDEFAVNIYTQDSQGWPSVAAAPDGSFVVIRESRGQVLLDWDVFAQRYDPEGNPRGRLP